MMSHPLPKTAEALRRLGRGSKADDAAESSILDADFFVVSDPAVANVTGNVDGYAPGLQGGHVRLHNPSETPSFLRCTV